MTNVTPHQRRVLPLFADLKAVTPKEIATFFEVSERQARHICNLWMKEGFIEIVNADPEMRTYKFCDQYGEPERRKWKRNPLIISELSL